jgi:hypothetical protein
LSGNGHLLSTYTGEDMHINQLVLSIPSAGPQSKIKNPKSKMFIKPSIKVKFAHHQGESRRIKVKTFPMHQGVKPDNKSSISRPAGLHYAKVHQLEHQQKADVQAPQTASSQIKVNQP